MSSNVNFDEILVTPLASIVRKIAESVAEAQIKLDEAAMTTAKSLAKEHAELQMVGYSPTWYHIPEINAELKMVMHYEQKGEKASAYWSPFNAKYQSGYSFAAEGTSQLKLKIVSVPPPVGVSAAKPE